MRSLDLIRRRQINHWPNTAVRDGHIKVLWLYAITVINLHKLLDLQLFTCGKLSEKNSVKEINILTNHQININSNKIKINMLIMKRVQ